MLLNMIPGSNYAMSKNTQNIDQKLHKLEGKHKQVSRQTQSTMDYQPTCIFSITYQTGQPCTLEQRNSRRYLIQIQNVGN